MSRHIPILVEPILKALIEPFSLLPPDSEPHYLVDVTLGGGGHTNSFLQAFQADPKLRKHKVLALDQDAQAIRNAQSRFQTEIAEGRLEVMQCRFGDAESLLRSRPVLGLLADLGFSSDQMDDPTRGLSFHSESALDMRLDPSRGQSCYEILEEISESELEKVLAEFGEERFARRIARAIVDRRQNGDLPKTPKELARVIVFAIPSGARHGRIHAATRSFQALRILVNEEVSQLERLLEHVIIGIKFGGRAAVISFHSLEDRMVKNRFRQEDFVPLFKKPLVANDSEIAQNPRARSAKLRIAEKSLKDTQPK